MKRLLSWLLVLVMVFGLLPMSAFAVDVETGNGDDDFELGMDELLPTEPEFGTAENPYVIPVGDRTNFVGIAVPAGGSVYAVADNTTGPYNVVMGTYDAAYNVVYNPRLPGAVWYAEADADGYYQINELMDQPFSYTLQVNNPSDTDLYIIAWLTAGDTTGTMGDPAQLVIGENEVTLKSGSQGYYYTWTAEEDGTLILNIDSNVAGWTYVVNNMTTYKYGDTQWSDSDPVVNPAEIEVAAGDELQIIVNTYDPADEFNAPAGTVTVNASFEAAPEIPAELTPINFSAIEVSYDSEILLWLKFTIPADVLADDNGYFILTKYKGTEIKQQQQITIAELKAKGTDSKGRYILEQGIASPEMTAPVTVQFVDSYGRSVNIVDYVSGEAVDTLTRCVLDYARLALEKGTAKQKKMVTALLVYGGYAQKYFSGFDPENPAYNLLAEYNIALPDIVNTINADTITQEVTYSGNTSIGINHTSQQGFLDSAIYYEQYFTLSSGYSIDDFKFEITYRNKDGSTYIEEVTPVFQSSRNRYIVTIYDIASIYLDHMYTITVTNINTNEQFVIQNSVNAWLKRGIAASTNVNQVNLFKAIYYYNQAANEFFGD